MPTPNQAAIDSLRQHPETAPQFDEVFGTGTSSRYTVPQDSGLLSQIGSVAADIGSGIANLPDEIGAGGAQAINETGNLLYSGVNAGAHAIGITALPDKNPLSIPDSAFANSSVTGGLIQGASQFATGMLFAGKYLKAVGYGAEGVTGALAKGALASATVFDPHAERLSNLIQQVPALQNPITDFLAAKPGDSDAFGRFKNALEGTGLGLFTEGLARAVNAFKLGKTGDLKGAVAELDAAEQPHSTAQAALEVATNTPEQAVAAAEAATAPVEGQATAAPQAGNPQGRAYIDAAAPPKVAGPIALTPEQLDQYRANLSTRYSTPVGPQAGHGMATAGVDFNFNQFHSEDDIKAAINAMATVVQEEIGKVVGGNEDGIRTHQIVKMQSGATLARIVGENPEFMVQRMTEMAGSVKNLDSFLKASGDFVLTLGDHSDKLAQMVIDGSPGAYGDMGTLHSAYAHSTNMLANSYATLKGIQTNTARALNAMKLGRDVHAGMRDALQTVDPEHLAALQAQARRQAALADITDPIEKAKAQRLMVQGSLLQKVLGIHNEYWFNAVLSGVPTHIVNATTNAMNSLYHPAERMLAGLLGRNNGQFLEGAQQYAGMAQGLRDSFTMAKRSFQIGDNVLDNHRVLPGVVDHQITAANFGIAKNSPFASIVDGIGTVVRLPSRFLVSSDELFKQISYRGRVYAQAMREAEGKGMAPADVSKFVQDKLDNAFSSADASVPGIGTNPVAIDQARENTFTQPLGEGTLGRWLEQGVQQHPGLRVIVPFVRVPTNIMRFVWQRTPGIGLVQRQNLADLRAGGERANMTWARQTMGAGICALAATAAYEGKITGNGPVDPELRKTWLLTNQPYSFVSTDANGKKTFISYSRADPYGVFFGLAADITQTMGQLNDEDAGDLAKAFSISVAHNLTSKTYLQGIVQAADALNNPDTMMQRMAQQRAASYIPNIISGVKDDPNFHEVRSVLDAMQAKIPGLSTSLPPRRDVLGQAMTVPQGEPWDAVNPFTVRVIDPDPVRNEMARLATGDQSIRFPMPNAKIAGSNLDLTQVKNATGVSAYDRWQQLIGEKLIGGLNLHDSIAQHMQRAEYQKAADGTQEFRNSRKVDIIEQQLSQYRNQSFKAMLREYPDLAAALQGYKQQNNRVKTGLAPTSDPFSIFKQ